MSVEKRSKGREGAPAAIGDLAGAAEALRAETKPRHPRLREAETALKEGRGAEAQQILSRFLEKRPRDAMALYLMAETALRLDQKEEGEALLAQCLSLEPNFIAARYSYANALAMLGKPEAALEQIDLLLKSDSSNILFRNLKAVVLTAVGAHGESMLCHRAMAEDFPNSPEVWRSYGSALRSVGLRDESIAAYRKAIELRPTFGESYWSLAGLKDYRFDDAEIAQMEGQLMRTDLSGDDRMHIHFALGKAWGDKAQYEKSFESYARANAIRRLNLDYNPEALAKHVRACKTLFTREFVQERSEAGSDRTGPIFIIGMQRAGSTLVEQILASHSAIEATAELPNISLLAQHIGETIAPRLGSSYPAVLAKLDRTALKSFGEQYIETTRSHRRRSRPLFVDKMPYNFLHVGLIHLILSKAKIIDVRRHPLGCCFSNFAMHFKSGALFAYRLGELGQAYAKYVELMAHFDRVLPGRVHRIHYEHLVATPEQEIRRLLDHVGVPFEEACFAFHETRRAMDSASSEQVHRPIYGDAVDQWRNYEPWLGPLKAALGPVLDDYPEIPRGFRIEKVGGFPTNSL